MAVSTTEVLAPGPAARSRSLPWGAIVFSVALLAGLAMAFVVFRIQSLVDPNIDPY